ncbi:MAG TPA: c-type cytochrome [Candidatus Acidoferrum sp.]|nr:c-type cytochrome [Candidatus Acidoferrum sp.]
MKKLIASLLLPLVALPLQAAEPVEKLMDEARCYACHQLKDTLIGPPWQAIAARHVANRKLMLDVLARKIVRGGGGDWGDVPMVPNEFTSIDEARAMASWILDQQPKQK